VNRPRRALKRYGFLLAAVGTGGVLSGGLVLAPRTGPVSYVEKRRPAPLVT
jgi:hypothetical protein